VSFVKTLNLARKYKLLTYYYEQLTSRISNCLDSLR